MRVNRSHPFPPFTPFPPMATTPSITPTLLAAQLVEAQASLKQWQDYCDALKAQLTQLHDEGIVPTAIEVPGYSVKLTPGRVTLVLDDEYKAKVSDLQQEALETGHGHKKQGSSFWTVRAVKQ